jgi:hypothetical protein
LLLTAFQADFAELQDPMNNDRKIKTANAVSGNWFLMDQSFPHK